MVRSGDAVTLYPRKKFCECGCGTEIEEKRRDGGIRRYLTGHHTRGKSPHNKGKPGIPPWNKGIPCPDGIKDKISKRIRNRIKNGEIKYKRGKDHHLYNKKLRLGKTLTDETKEKIRKSLKRGYMEGRIKKSRTVFRIGEHRSPKTEFKKFSDLNDNQKIEVLTKMKKNKTGLEKYAEEILLKMYPGEWSYVGDGIFWIGFKNPDFISTNGKKVCIEVYNTWHKKKFFGSVNNYKEKRREHFENYGWKTIFLDHKEIRDREIIKKMVREV